MTRPKNDMQDLTQLGDQLSEAIAKIEPNVIQLQDATKHLENLQTLPQKTQEQIKSSIKAVSQQCAETLVMDMASKIEMRILDILQPLDRSAQYAIRALHNTKRRKRIRLLGFICLSCMIVGLVGLGGGYYLGSQRISLPSGVKILAYPISSTPQISSQKPNNIVRRTKKNEMLENK